MRVLVIHETYWGNTAQVAESIAAAFLPSHQVKLLAAADVDELALRATDLVVVGAPTHVHGLPGRRSRAMAVKQGRLPRERERASGVRELLDRMPQVGPLATAAFDTRLPGRRLLTGAASRAVARRLRRKGYRCVVAPQSFIVQGRPPALLPGELARAQEWAHAVMEAAARVDSHTRPSSMAPVPPA